MSRTVLFFGDSNTRGAGVGPEARFAALLEADLACTADGAWTFAIGHSASDFHVIPERLDAALAKHAPDIVVLQCPTGPVAYWINYPPWMRWLTASSNRSFRWLTELYIRAYTKLDPERSKARRDVLYEGKFLDPLYRWNVAQWLGVRHFRRWFAARYGTIVKVTGPRYVQLVCRLRDRLRKLSKAKVLLLGLIPHSEDYYPGYQKRASEFSKLLEAALHRPEENVVYFDLHSYLMPYGTRDLLIRDGRHLSAEGHRRVAEAVVPILKRLITDCDRPPPSRDS